MSNYIEEEITLAEFADRFLGTNDYSNPMSYDIEDMNIEVLTLDEYGNAVYKPIKSFLIKESVNEYFTDGKIKVTGNHRFIENGETVFAKDHIDFTKVDGKMHVVDIEVADLHSYLANGRLNHNTTSGGKALAFHASVRLRLKSLGQVKAGPKGAEKIVGIKVRAQVVKNRLGPPLRHADFSIFFDRGIDNYGSWLETMKDYKLVKQGGAWYEYIDVDTGEVIKFQAKDFAEILNGNETLKDQIYRRICDTVILKYKNSASEEVEITTDEAYESD